MQIKNLSSPEKWIIIGIPVLFILASLFHFLYYLTGHSRIIGLFVPVNESVWEHLKMLLVPVICWWSIYYLFNGEKYNINKDKWFFSALIALISSMLGILFLYYTYSGALGVELLVVDILITFISILIGQILGLHFYKYGKAVPAIISITLLLFLVLIFIVFTVKPPHLPLFKDTTTGKYGI